MVGSRLQTGQDFYAGINGGYSWGVGPNGTAPIGGAHTAAGLGSAEEADASARKVANQGKSVLLALDAMMPMVADPESIPNRQSSRPRSPVPWIIRFKNWTTQFRSSCQFVGPIWTPPRPPHSRFAALWPNPERNGAPAA